MGHRNTSLPTKNAVHRFRVALWVSGVLAVALGSAGLYVDRFAYDGRFGLGSTHFLVLVGVFFLVLAIFWRPKTRN